MGWLVLAVGKGNPGNHAHRTGLVGAGFEPRCFLKATPAGIGLPWNPQTRKSRAGRGALQCASKAFSCLPRQGRAVLECDAATHAISGDWPSQHVATGIVVKI